MDSDTGRVRQMRGDETDEIKCGKEGESRDGGMQDYFWRR